MRTVFLGTPEAAVPSLGALASISEVLAVFTQPDRPRGRSRTPQPTPVKIAADELGLAVHQPTGSAEIAPLLERLGAIDVAVVVAYGMLIRPEALAVPRRGFVNLHFSLLPRWRGAAPVQRAIEARDPRTGVTLMQLDEGLDTGPTLVTVSTALSPHETAGEVLDRLSITGADVLGSSLAGHVEGRIVALPQRGEDATHAAKVTSGERALDLSAAGVEVVAKIHALSPGPGAHAFLDGDRFKVLRARLGAPVGSDRRIGELWQGPDGSLCVRVGDSDLELIEVQPAGKRAMAGAEWARGRQGSLGSLT